VKKIIGRWLWLTMMLWSTLSIAKEPDGYGYPVLDPVTATVLGTPKYLQFATEVSIRDEERELIVFPDRTVPPLFQYSRSLHYSLVRQSGRAPLIFIIAGAGGRHFGRYMDGFKRAFYQAGFHVIALPSPTHPDFMISASSRVLPGHLPDDARDLYRVMQLIISQVHEEIEVSRYYLTGYSLGAAHAAFISRLDEDERQFHFARVLLLDPPVDLLGAAHTLDGFINAIPGGIANSKAFFDRVLSRIAHVYSESERVSFGDDFLYTAYYYAAKQEEPHEVLLRDLTALIGLSFRFTSANLVFTSDVMNHTGYLVPAQAELTSTDSITDYFKVAMHVSFDDYFHDLYYPAFVGLTPGLSEAELARQSSLRSLADYLAQTPKIGVFTNADELILSADDRAFLRKTFGRRATIFPRGGHLGNLLYRENVRAMLAFFHP
jgi:Alpha/beta hydrolase family